MCNFLSFVVTLEKNPRILCADLRHHEKTVECLGLKPETYREAEWLAEDDGKSLTVRAAPGENPNILKSAVLALYPTRATCLDEFIMQIGKAKVSTLDLRGTAVKTLPELPNVKYLDLRGTAVKKADLPLRLQNLAIF